MASNETSKYKLSVVEGTELQLSISTGVQGPAGPAGADGPAGPNEITTATETNLTGFIYGNGTNIGGAVEAANSIPISYDDLNYKLARYDNSGSLYVSTFLTFGVSSRLGNLYFPTGELNDLVFNWTLPDASGTLSLEGHEHDASDITSGTFDNARINFAAPSAIGSGTPNTGAFTTLSATGTATLPHIHGSLAGDLYIHVKNTSGVPLTRGTPVYIVGNVGDTDRVEVAAADNTNPAKMPAVGLLDQDLENNATGDAVILGELPAANTNAYTLNQELFVGAGALTGTKPTTGEVQSVGVVSRVQSNSGVIVVNMQGRRKTDVTAPTADTVALRNAFGGISAKHIRLHGDTYYAQINPSPTLTQDVAVTLPTNGGLLTTTATAVTVTGEQTVAGAKTFSGQMELTGQSATNGTSALTRDLGDARYPLMLKSYTTASITGLSNSTILVPITSLALEAGTYYIEVAAATYTPTGTPANTTIRFTTVASGAGEYTGSDDYGTGTLTHVDVEADPMSLTFIRQSVGTASTFFRNLRGILTINTATTLKLEFRQSVASTNVITCRAGAYIIARKIS